MGVPKNEGGKHTLNTGERLRASAVLMQFKNGKRDNSDLFPGWNYTDQASWSQVTDSQCSLTSQSPINFPPMVEMKYSENLKPFTFTGYENAVTSPEVSNNGHTSKLNAS